MPAAGQSANEFDFHTPANREKAVACGAVLNEVLDAVTKWITEEGERCTFELCTRADALILASLAKQFKKPPKGLAAPTAISVNAHACNYSPLEKAGAVQLAPGDLVKIELGAHLDNFPTHLTHTLLVPETDGAKKLSDRAEPECLRPLLASHLIRKAALVAMQAGKKAAALEPIAKAIAESLGVTLVEDVRSQRLGKFLDSNATKAFALNPSAEKRRELGACTFETNDLFELDIALTNSAPDADGRPKSARLVPVAGEPTTLFQLLDPLADSAVKSARDVLRDITKTHGANVFHLRSVVRDAKSRFGWQSVSQLDSLDAFAVTAASNGQLVYWSKFTYLVRANSPKLIAGRPCDEEAMQSVAQRLAYAPPADVAAFLAGKQI